MADVFPSGAGPPRVPGHVAWIGGGASGAREASGDVASESRAVAELCAGALELGVRWLTVRVRCGAAHLCERLAPEMGPAVAVDVLEPGYRRLGARTGRARQGSPAAAWRLGLVLSDGGSGRQELVHAVRALADADPEEVDEDALRAHLYRPDVPDPDLVVVSGGDRRVPDVLLWEMAYSELVFLDEQWPAIDRTHLAAAVGEYQRRDRRYGGLVYQGGPR